jgi:lipoprotein-anchoring transpeptidase ErfK/SrfK
MRQLLALSAVVGTAVLISVAPLKAADPADSPLVKAAASAAIGVDPTPAQPAAPAADLAASAGGLEPTSAPASLAAETVKPKPQPPSLVARINLWTQRMEVSVNGQAKHAWAISSGRSGYASPRGTFRVQWTAKMWYSRKYDMAPMPHAVFFKDGVAVHATTAVGMLGRPASHGCIRLAPANAALFYALVHKHGVASTQIQVFGASPAEQIAQRKPRGDSAPERIAVRSAKPAADGAPVARVASHFPPGSPYYGRPAFVHNGVIYVKVR